MMGIRSVIIVAVSLFAVMISASYSQEVLSENSISKSAQFIHEWSTATDATKRPNAGLLSADEQFQVAIALRYYLANKDTYKEKLRFDIALNILRELSSDAAYEGILYIALYGSSEDANATLYAIMFDSGWSCMASYLKILERTDIDDSLKNRLKLKLDTYLTMMPSSIYEKFDNSFLNLDASTDKTTVHKEFSRLYAEALNENLPYIVNLCSQKIIVNRIMQVRALRKGVGNNLYPAKEGPAEAWAKKIMDAVEN